MRALNSLSSFGRFEFNHGGAGIAGAGVHFDLNLIRFPSCSHNQKKQDHKINIDKKLEYPFHPRLKSFQNKGVIIDD
jgi:hypothetical protein